MEEPVPGRKGLSADVERRYGRVFKREAQGLKLLAVGREQTGRKAGKSAIFAGIVVAGLAAAAE